MQAVLHRLGLPPALEEKAWADPRPGLAGPGEPLPLTGKRRLERVPRSEPRRHGRVDVAEGGFPELGDGSWIGAVERHLYLLHARHQLRLRRGGPVGMASWRSRRTRTSAS